MAVPRFPIGSRRFPHRDHHKRFPRFPPPLRGGEPGNCVGGVGTARVIVPGQISNYCPSHVVVGPRRGNRSKRHRPAPRGVRAVTRRRGRFPGYLRFTGFLGGRLEAKFGDREPFWGTARERRSRCRRERGDRYRSGCEERVGHCSRPICRRSRGGNDVAPPARRARAGARAQRRHVARRARYVRGSLRHTARPFDARRSHDATTRP